MTDIWKISNIEDRLTFMVDQVERLTGNGTFGIYINKMLTIDALFLNEDRHLHNIAVLMNGDNQLKLCPFFDHGAALLADTTVDYPMGVDVIELMGTVKAKTLCESFEDALDASEKLFGQNIRFHFNKSNVDEVLNECMDYPEPERKRVEQIIYQQMRKYQYLFE